VSVAAAVLGAVLGGCVAGAPAAVSAPVEVEPRRGPGDTVHLARGHYLVAVWHAAHEDCERADLGFGRALLFDPGRPEVLLAQGRTRIACGRTLDGEAVLVEAGRRGATVAYGEVARSAWDQGRRDDAERAVSSWVGADLDPVERAARGRWRVALGDLEGGLDDLAAGLPFDPDNGPARDALVAAATRLQRLQTLWETLLATLARRPGSPELLQLTGDLAAEIGDDGTARELYARLDRARGESDARVALDRALVALRTDDAALARALLPRSEPFPVHVRAGLLGLSGDLAAAEALSATGVEGVKLDLRMADLYQGRGELDAALEVLASLREATEGITPDAVDRIEARYLANAGRHEEALDVLRGGTSEGVLALRVQLWLELGRPEQALTEADAGLARWPSSRLLAARRLQALEDLGRTAEAVAGALRLVEVQPSRRPVLILARHSEPSEAVLDALERCIEQHPGQAEVWLELARVRWSMDRTEDATPALQRGLALRGRDTPLSERYSPMCEVLACQPMDGGAP